MRYDPETTIPICADCVTNDDTVKLCVKCGIGYCVHFASSTDISFCSNCLEEFKAIETIETKVTERLNAEGVVIARQKQIARNIRLEGMDWLFMSKKISSMTDEEIFYSIEYHGAIKSLLVNEREERKVEHFSKMRGIKLAPSARPLDSDTTATTSSKGKRKSKIDKSQPDANAVAAALGTILKAKIDPAAIAAALAALKK